MILFEKVNQKMGKKSQFQQEPLNLVSGQQITPLSFFSESSSKISLTGKFSLQIDTSLRKFWNRKNVPKFSFSQNLQIVSDYHENHSGCRKHYQQLHNVIVIQIYLRDRDHLCNHMF